MINKIIQVRDEPVYVSPQAHRAARIVLRSIAVAAGLILLSWVYFRADHLTTMQQAKTAKQEAQIAVDRTTNFARIITDGSGQIISWNRGARETTGFRADEMIGKPIADVIAPSAMDSAAAQALLTGGTAEGNLLLRRAGTKHGTVLIKANINTASDFRYVVGTPAGEINTL